MSTISENKEFLENSTRFPKLTSVEIPLPPNYKQTSEEYNKIIEYLGQLYERSENAVYDVDTVLDPISQNPISNEAVAEALEGQEAEHKKVKVSFFRAIMTSGTARTSSSTAESTPDEVYFFSNNKEFGLVQGLITPSTQYFNNWVNRDEYSDGTYPYAEKIYYCIEERKLYVWENNDLVCIGGGGEVDSELSTTSQNAVQNRVVTTALNTKFAGISFVEGVLHLYADENKTIEVASITLGATSYVVSQNADHDTSFHVLTGESEHIFTVSPSTLSSVFGTQAPFVENYNIVVSIKGGSGNYVEKINSTVQANRPYSFDIRNWMITGENTLKINITGQSSQVSTEVEYTANLTSLEFNCDFSWWKAWVGGSSFGVDGITFYGTLQKTLYVRIDGDNNKKYSQVFNAQTNNRTVPYTFPISDKWTNLTTGIHEIEVWLEGGGTSTQVFTYNVMVVNASDVSTAKLVVMNDFEEYAKNYASTTALFKFATYNTNTVIADVSANDGEKSFVIADNVTLSGISTQTPTDYPVSLAMESYVQTTDFTLTAILKTPDNHTDSHTFVVDNSESYAPATDARVYFNLAARSNSEGNRTTFINEADGAQVASYAGTFTNFAWNNDGYTTDDDGNMCLKVPAGNTISIKQLFPLVNTQTTSTTIEFMYRVKNVADYNTPVFSMMSTETYNENTNGIILFPTQLKVLSSAERRHTFQSYNLSEDDILHIAIVFQRNYASKSQHICRFYVNGCPITNFEFSGTSIFNGTYSYVRMGQEAADFYLYMFRMYQRALEPSDVLNNFLNAIIENNEYSRRGLRNDNGIMDGGSISYELAKQKGFNCYVIETDEELPSVDNQVTISSLNIRLEYAEHPEWNVRIVGVPMDGQGTTSKRYFRWNLRDNNKNSNARWEYLNIFDDDVMRVEIGKAGYIAGYGLHPKVSKITAKKNTASSSQGHKMGATNLYNDLWHKFFDSNLSTTQRIPDTDTRVAVYQYPFLGFKMSSGGYYEFVGLYTIGPDKTDKKTFGYDKTSTYPNLMMIEGPNHAPRMTRFLCPWTSDINYSSANETLQNYDEEGWDADIVADYSSDESGDEAAIQALYESEFKPAYDLIFFTSPYIRPLSATGKTIAQINSDIETFWNGTTSGYKNSLLTLYDSNYNLYYYRIKTEQYESLGVNIRTYLGLTGSPTETQIQNACAEKFLNEIGNYVFFDEAKFHYCFCELIGATDNDAKNTYWRKFKALLNGGKWGFNQDDLDTILPSDNNGQSTKSYSIEHGDVTGNGDEVFQGQTSAFWERIRISCDLRGDMVNLINKMGDIASDLNITAPTLHERILKVFSHYFWESSSKYFPAIAYAEDTKFTYITPWVLDHTKTYNAIEPLTQALGTQYNAELIWVQRRIAYIFSRFKIGGFGGATGEYGQLDITPSEANTANFNLVPAIDIYPRESIGGYEPRQGARTRAGETCVITPTTASGATNFYLLGLDLYSSLGDLSQLVLTTRGASSDTEISFAVHAKRLRSLKVGGTGTVLFNATSLLVSGAAIESIDARNASRIQGEQDLTRCPRLRTAYFAGTIISQLRLPVGGKVTNISLPSTIDTLFLYSLPLLTTANIAISGYGNIVSLYVNNCARINPVTLCRACYNAGSVLKYISLLWSGSVNGQASDIEMLAYMANHIYNPQTGNGYGSVSYDPTTNTIANVDDKPILEGTLNISNGSATRDDINLINSVFPNLNITGIVAYYITFADDEAKRVMLQVVGDSNGITEAQAASLSTMGRPNAPAVSLFYQNTVVTSFNEFTYFTGIRNITQGLFQGCTNLRSVVMPKNITGTWSETFQGCTRLTSVNLPNSLAAPTESYNVFNGCTSLVSVTLPSSWTYIGHQMFAGCTSLNMTIPSSVTKLGYRAFANSGIRSGKLLSSEDGAGIYEGCTRLTSVDFYSGITAIPDTTFSGCTNLALSSLPSTVTTIGHHAFADTAVTFSSLPNGLTSIGVWAFANCTSLAITAIPSGVTEITDSCFRGCSGTNIATLNNGITAIGEHAFDGAGISISALPTGYTSTSIGAYAFNGTNVSISALPSSVTTIGEYAFSSCPNITNFTFRSTVTSIGHHAFAYCANFDTASLPSGLTEIAEAAFDGTSLSVSSLPSNITSIGNYAFQSTSLTITSIPSGVTSIGAGAFLNVSTMQLSALPSALRTIGSSAFQNTHEGFAGEVGTGITSIGDFAFVASNVTKVHLGSSMTACHKPFQGCSQLTEIIMERSSVTELEERFAYYCSSLETIDLPNNITLIDVQAFYRSSTYTTVNLRVVNPASLTMETEAFPTGQTIHVPSGSQAAYTAKFPEYTFIGDL